MISDGGIKASIYANCSLLATPQEDSSARRVENVGTDSSVRCWENNSVAFDSGLLSAQPVEESEEDVILEIFFDLDEHQSSQDFVNNCLAYVAGYLAVKLKYRGMCGVCQDALASSEKDPLPTECRLLIDRKNKKKHYLTVPSHSVFKLIVLSEKVFEAEVFLQQTLPTSIHLTNVLTNKVTRHLDFKQYFPTLSNHGLEQNVTAERNHLVQLVTKVVKRYFRFRIRSYGKTVSSKNQPLSKRNQLGKLLQFIGM